MSSPSDLAPAPRAAVERAREAFSAWGSLAAVVCGETGKSRADAVLAEALHAAAHVDWCARHAARVLAPRKVSPWPLYSKAACIEYQPRGVAAVISPWNYPFLLPFLAT